MYLYHDVFVVTQSVPKKHVPMNLDSTHERLQISKNIERNVFIYRYRIIVDVLIWFWLDIASLRWLELIENQFDTFGKPFYCWNTYLVSRWLVWNSHPCFYLFYSMPFWNAVSSFQGGRATRTSRHGSEGERSTFCAEMGKLTCGAFYSAKNDS